MRKHATLLTMLGLMIALLTATSASAYVYYGYPAVYKFQGGISTGYFDNYAANSISYNGRTYHVGSAFTGAVSLWKEGTEFGMVQLPSGSTATPKIRMFSAILTELRSLDGWVERFKASDGSSMGQYGDSKVTENWSKVYIFMNVHAIDYKRYDFVKYRAVAVHELGHALGLQHHNDTGVPSVMHASVGASGDMLIFEKGWTYPQPDDVAGVNNLYP